MDTARQFVAEEAIVREIRNRLVSAPPGTRLPGAEGRPPNASSAAPRRRAPRSTLRPAGTRRSLFGRLPAFLMTNAREVEINAGVELFGGNANGSFLIHTGQGRIYLDDGFLEEILFHEAAHVSLDATHAGAPGLALGAGGRRRVRVDLRP